MPYNYVPVRTEKKRESCPKMAENFTILQPFLQHDHNALALGNGDHTVVNLVNQTTHPVTIVGDCALYAMNYYDKSHLFAHADLLLPQPISASGKGWAREASGILMKWGFNGKNGVPANLDSIEYPTIDEDGKPIPEFVQVFTAQVSFFYNPPAHIQQDDDREIRITSLADHTRINVQVSYRFDTAPLNDGIAARVTWLAIGI